MSVRISRSAQASWQGTVPEGGGRIALDSGAYEGEFTLQNRIAEDVRDRTNPEELIAAAQAGCFTMSLERVRLEQKDEGFRITRISVKTVGDVPGFDPDRLVALAQEAKDTCPVSLALAGTEITLEASLAQTGP